MIPGSRRPRTSLKIARTRGGVPASLGRYAGSLVTTAATASAASSVRPSASRQSARFCWTSRTSGWGSGCFCRRSSIASASSYDADAYSACAACTDSCARTAAGQIRMTRTANAMRLAMISSSSGLLLRPGQVHAEPNWRGGRHRRRVVLLAEVGVLEDDLVRADRAASRLPIGVSPAFSPSIHTSAHGVAFRRQRALRQRQRQTGRLAREDLGVKRLLETQRFADNAQVVRAGRQR